MLYTEKAMAPHSGTLAWKIPWTEEPGSPWGCEEPDTTERLCFHFSLSTFMHWRRKWQPTPVFLPGKSHGQRSLVGYSSWGCKRVKHDLVTKQHRAPRSWVQTPTLPLTTCRNLGTLPPCYSSLSDFFCKMSITPA